MENNTNNKKKKIRLLIIGLIVLLITIIGATYAYFSITGTNNSSSSVITNTFGESGNVTLTGSNTLHITLNATDMATNNKGNIYYATDVQSENYKTTSTSYEVAKATVVGGDDSQSYSNCKFNLNVALSGDMANLLQEGDMKITFSGAYTGTYDLSNLSSPYEVTLSNLSGTNRTQSINAVVEFNNLDKDQVYLAGKTLTITLTNTDFSCNGTTQPAYTIASGDLDTVGSEVCIDTECFYVIGKEGNNVKLFAKYSLKVGDIYSVTDTHVGGNFTKVGEINSNDEGYGLQSPSHNGQVPFSDTNYWHDTNTNSLKPKYSGNYWPTGNPYPYVYDETSNAYAYIENYVNYLNTLGVNVTGRLISYEEANELANSTLFLDIINTNLMYFYTGTARSSQSIYMSNASLLEGSSWYLASYDYNLWYEEGYGIAPAKIYPVIILEP